MLNLTNRKILFVFSDPGGAKPCLAIAKQLKKSDITIISDRVYPFYSTFDLDVDFFKGDPADFLKKLKFDLIFTGTSYTSTLELDFITFATQNEIPCWSFVDHWTNIRRRFINNIGELILPDKVWVIDERAKAIAILEGINQEKIVVSGNPYHAIVKHWLPKITKSQFYEILKFTIDKKIITFAFDPISNIKGKNLFGFDEISVLQELSDMSKDIMRDHPDWIFLIKPHPNQDVGKLLTVIDRIPLFKVVSDKLDANDIIFFSDIIIGFFSSFLLEAQIMSKVVMRVLPNDIVNDPFAEMNVGTTVDLKNLIGLINKSLNE